MTHVQAATLRRERLEEMVRDFRHRADARTTAIEKWGDRPRGIGEIEMVAERDGYDVAANAVRLLAAGVLTP